MPIFFFLYAFFLRDGTSDCQSIYWQDLLIRSYFRGVSSATRLLAS